MVHLTEIVHDASGRKRTVELHLCLEHAVEAGLVMPGAEMLPQVTMGKPASAGVKKMGGGVKMTIVPTVIRGSSQTSDPTTCPTCGLTWMQFKQTGLMGCPHDYELFERKLLPLLKRVQEGANDHMGKVPPRSKTQETDRQVTSLRLRRELQKAIDVENYEKAAHLRDELRTIEAI